MARQFFKSIYFSDYPTEESKEKSITIAFSEADISCYNVIKDMTTQEIKQLLGLKSYKQLASIANREERSINQVIKRLVKRKMQEDQSTITINAARGPEHYYH